MSLDEPTNGKTPPVVLAGMASILTLPVMLMATLPASRFIHARWALLLPVILIPLLTAFITLYRSAWHPEYSKSHRIVSGILSSVAIYFVDVLVVAVLAIIGCIILGSLRVAGGN